MSTFANQVWYSIHLPAGLPEMIARAANERQISPGEFLELAVKSALVRDTPRAFTIHARPAPTTVRRKSDDFTLAFG